MSIKQLLQDVFGDNQRPPPRPDGVASGSAPAPPAGPPRISLPPPPGARPVAQYSQGTGTAPMDAMPAQAAPPANGNPPTPAADDHARAAAAQHYAAAQQNAARQHGVQQPPGAVAEAAHAFAPRAHDSDGRSQGTLGAAIFGGLVGTATLMAAAVVVISSVKSARHRLEHPDQEAKPLVAIAREAEVAYCTKDFKQVLERVLHSCGLSAANERRGCKPADIKTFAAINDADFNALFHPLQDRGGVLMFDEGIDELDDSSKQLLEKRWFDRKGARYFFVVARASKTGTQAKNRALSHRRANSVLFHLEEVSGESKEDLAKQVGLLWLGNEFAQLSDDYCSWPRSRQGECSDEAINRSAFVSWVDCRL